MADKYEKRTQSQFAPEITICYFPYGQLPRSYSAGWSLEKDGRTDSPLALIADEKIRKLVMAEASDLAFPLGEKLKLQFREKMLFTGVWSTFKTVNVKNRVSFLSIFNDGYKEEKGISEIETRTILA